MASLVDCITINHFCFIWIICKKTELFSNERARYFQLYFWSRI